MKTEITRDELEKLCSFPEAERAVERALAEACAKPELLVRFLGRYATWNGWFGSGVAALAGKIGRSRALFVDPSEPVVALADRSVLVGSFFFDAARDEFDDRDTAHRDTHRCLAQAMLKGTLAHAARNDQRFGDPEFVNHWLESPLWLKALGARVAQSYGAGTPDDAAAVFRAMGYHLGSEVLADKEFSAIDSTLRESQPDLVAFLSRYKARIGGEEHLAYQWLRIHSGHGGGVEADHFAWATRGARLAFDYVAPALQRELRRQIDLGFVDFARDHREFFEQVGVD
jgi:hypothetical protein